jgi:hypothetical protein
MLPVLFSLPAEGFGDLPVFFLVLASLCSHSGLVRQLFTVLFRSHAALFGSDTVLFRSSAQLLGRLAYFFADLELGLGCLLPLLRHRHRWCSRLTRRHSALALRLRSTFLEYVRHALLQSAVT